MDHLNFNINCTELHGFKFVIISGRKTLPNLKIPNITDKHEKGTCDCSHYCPGAEFRQRYYGTSIFPPISRRPKLSQRWYEPKDPREPGELVRYARFPSNPVLRR